MRHTQQGLSMVELIVGMSIVSILMAIGVPSYRYVTTSNRMSSEVNGLLWDMQFARSEAIKEGRMITVCPSTDGTSCASSSSWAGGWIVFMDPSNTGVVDAGESVLRYQPAFNSQDTFTADSAITSVSFNREGFAAMTGVTSGFVTVTLHDKNTIQQWTRCLQITSVGMLTTQRHGDGSCT